MYQPFDLYGYQAYNNPQPEHYAPPGMPQPSRPSGLTDPAYSFSHTAPYPSFDSQSYGSQHNTFQQAYYPSNSPATQEDYSAPYAHSSSLQHSISYQYPHSEQQPTSSLSHSGSIQYPPAAPPDPSFYPAVSSAPYATVPVESSSWTSNFTSLLSKTESFKHDERHGFHSVAKPDDKNDNISFSVKEAQAIIKQLKEDNNSLKLQLTNSRDASIKVASDKDAKIEELQRELDAARRQISSHVPDDPREAISAAEREWTQRQSLKEQENQERLAQLERDWAEKLSNSEQEISALRMEIVKLESSMDSGRALLLEANTAQEAALINLREIAKHREEELMICKEEIDKREQELMKLRDETNKLYDEITQMVDEKEAMSLSITKLEEEKRDLEEQLTQLKKNFDELMVKSNAIADEKKDLLKSNAALITALEVCRMQIDTLESEQLPTLNSQIELLNTLHEEAENKIAHLEDELKDARNARETAEQKLGDAEQREMETNLRLAGEHRSATEEIQKLRFQLDSHVSGISDNEKLESGMRSLEQKLAEVEGEKREALVRISGLEQELKALAARKDELDEELAIREETMDSEAQEHETIQKDLKLKIEKLEKEVSILTGEKSETVALLRSAENMLRVYKEEISQKAEAGATERGIEDLDEEKAMLEAKLAEANDLIGELQEKVEFFENENDRLYSDIDGMKEDLAKAESETIAKRRMEREIKGLRFDLGKSASIITNLEAETKGLNEQIETLSKELYAANAKMYDMEDNRSDLEQQFKELLNDKKSAGVKAAQLGEELLKKEVEIKEIKDQVKEISAKYLIAVAERDELEQANRNLLRNK